MQWWYIMQILKHFCLLLISNHEILSVIDNKPWNNAVMVYHANFITFLSVIDQQLCYMQTSNYNVSKLQRLFAWYLCNKSIGSCKGKTNKNFGNTQRTSKSKPSNKWQQLQNTFDHLCCCPVYLTWSKKQFHTHGLHCQSKCFFVDIVRVNLRSNMRFCRLRHSHWRFNSI